MSVKKVILRIADSDNNTSYDSLPNKCLELNYASYIDEKKNRQATWRFNLGGENLSTPRFSLGVPLFL